MYLITAENHPKEPDDEPEDGHSGDEDHPEPEEHVDLLVIKVNGQDALYRVAVNVTKTTHLKVAESHTREHNRLGIGPEIITTRV